MKKFNLLALVFVLTSLTLASFTARAQDFIIKKDKMEIKSKVLEITEDVIKYKKFDVPDGPTYSVRKSEVFMIVYSNGRKEYMDGNEPQKNVAAAPVENSTPAASDDDEQEKKERRFVSFSINDSGNATDVEGWWALSHTASTTGKLYLGVSVYSNFVTPASGGVYPFLGYKYAVDEQKNFNVWGNAGYNVAITDSYYIGTIHVPSTTAGSFLWEAGADYFFSDHFGITAYTSQGSSEWFGIIVRP